MSLALTKELEEAKKKVAELNLRVETSRKELAGLHLKFDSPTLNDFIKELRQAGKAPQSGEKRSTKGTAVVASVPVKGKRTRITPEIKSGVKSAVKAGKTGIEIAKQFGISLPSVHNIKKELGLVRARD